MRPTGKACTFPQKRLHGFQCAKVGMHEPLDKSHWTKVTSLNVTGRLASRASLIEAGMHLPVYAVLRIGKCLAGLLELIIEI